MAFAALSVNANAQAAWEVNMVRDINPRYPDNGLWKTLNSTAKPLAVAIPLSMLAVSLINDNKKLEMDAYETVAGLAITTVATEAMKTLVKRPRPYQTNTDIYPDEIDNSYGFPSGHTSVAFSTATSLFLASEKKNRLYIGIPAFIWATSVGYSRIYLGQHYPSDVLMGALVGAGGAYASRWLNKKFFFRKKNTVTVK